MLYSMDEVIPNIIRGEYKVNAKLEQQLGALLMRIKDELSAWQLYAIIDHLGCIVVHDEGEIFIAESNNGLKVPHAFKSGDKKVYQLLASSRRDVVGHDGKNSLTVPITYQDRQLGSIVYNAANSGANLDYCWQLLAIMAREMAFQIVRNNVSDRIRVHLGEEFAFFGTSAPLRELEVQVERSAMVDLPVLLEGEFGCGFLQTAYAIHFAGHRSDAPFVNINCAATKSDCSIPSPHEWLEQAAGGTLFLNNIDQLKADTQDQLAAILDMHTNRRIITSQGRGKAGVRIIAASTPDLSSMVDEGNFSRQLHDELNFLQIIIPPLGERKEDIQYYVEYFMVKYRQYEGQSISSDALAILCEYDWPGNLAEVERVVARLAIKSGKQLVALIDVEKIVPFVIQDEVTKPVSDNELVEQEYEEAISDPYHEDSGSVVLEELPRRILSNSMDFLDFHHPCIQKALKYISDNYQNEITLVGLAGASCVSSSHLCFLFRTELGTTFKSLLGMIRIEKAKNLLIEKPEQSITVVSLEVGFRDLSHFERIFRRLVGVNPREFRRKMKSGYGQQVISNAS